jgi:hypothetical protein
MKIPAARGLGLLTSALLATAFTVTTYTPASAATSASASSAATLLAPNRCNLRTYANPGSIWIPPNFENCYDCLAKAVGLREVNHLDTYCTYNPSNGKTDLHAG